MSEDYRVTFVLPSLLRYLEMRRLPEEFIYSVSMHNLVCQNRTTSLVLS